MRACMRAFVCVDYLYVCMYICVNSVCQCIEFLEGKIVLYKNHLLSLLLLLLLLFNCAGFGPFGSHTVNASAVAVWRLKQDGGLKNDSVELVVAELPVEYEAVKDMVPRLWKQHDPLVLLCPLQSFLLYNHNYV